MTEISDEIVPKYYRMDPKTEDLLIDGNSLADGMVVLIESPNLRHDLKRSGEEWEVDRLMTKNRWCRVSNVVIGGYGTVHFVGEYAEGAKIKREYSVAHGWIVKIESISDSMVLATSRYRNLHAMVSGLLRSTPPEEEFFADQVEEITRQILKTI